MTFTGSFSERMRIDWYNNNVSPVSTRYIALPAAAGLVTGKGATYVNLRRLRDGAYRSLNTVGSCDPTYDGEKI